MRMLLLSLLALAPISTAACSRARFPETEPGDPRAGAKKSDGPGDLAEEELHKLQGSWQVASSIWNGVPEPAAARTVTYLFQGDKVIVLDRDGNRYQEETIKLMSDQTPKAIDCWGKDGSQAAALGIYSLEADTLQWCSAKAANKVRPTSFGSEPGSRHSLMVLRRKKSI
jgi:uncharacterized protein (TIGR03067 family)